MISFINEFNDQMASYRYRTLVPAHEIGAQINNFDADVLVFSKPTHVGVIKQAKADGKKVVVDLCDDHFDHPSLGEIYRRSAQVADLVVCPTSNMQQRIATQVEKCPPIAVISEPYEMPESPPHAEGEKLLWFGHNVNLSAVSNKLGIYKHLTVVTGPKVAPGMIQWSHENLKKAMAETNIALFPTTKDQYYKSPNRLVNSLRAGLFPVCDKHPSYDEFKRFIWSTEVPTGLKWAREFKSELNDLVKAGQDYIRNRYSPQAIGRKWEEALRSL